MKKTLITVAVATLALSYTTFASADETAVTAPTPLISGAVSLDFAETAANKTAGTMGVELDIDAGDLATVDLDFKATDGDSLKLDTWTVGTTAGAVALAFGDSNGLLPETNANTTADGTLNVPTMTDAPTHGS